jgi:hypothetical protein
MAFVLADRVLETSTSTGTGSFVLAGARDGYQSFTDALANGDTTYYTITDGTDWEVGLGTWTESSATLARTTVLSSSNSGSAVNFGAGTKEVFISYPSGKLAEDTTAALLKSGGTMTGNLTLSGTNTRINLPYDHFINFRFEMDNADGNGVAYVLLCRNAANNDVNGRITMDRTSGLRHACQVDVIVSSGSSTNPIGSLKAHGVTVNTGSSPNGPSYELVTVTYDSDSNSYVALKIINPDNYYETYGAFFTGRLVNSGSNTLVAVPPSGISSEAQLADANARHTFQGDLDLLDNIVIAGTVDGRDIAADGTKLDGIATSATANPNAIDNIVEDTAPQLGGNLDTNGYGITLDDGNHNVTENHILLGNNGDLDIYHSSLGSVIGNNTSDLFITNVADDADVRISTKKSGSAGATVAFLADGSTGESILYHDGDQKIATKSTGIQTTGTVNVNGAYTFPTSDGTNGQVLTTDGSGAVTFQDASGGGSSLTIKDEGTSLSTAATTINFTGSGVTATGTGAEKTVNIPSVAKYTEFDLAPGATSVTLSLSGDSDVQKVEFRLAAKTTSSGPNNVTFTVKTSGGTNHRWDIQGMKMYNYTDTMTGLHVDGTTDIYSFLSYYNDFSAPTVFTFYKSEGDRWTCEATIGSGTGTTGTSYVLHCRTDFGYSYGDIGSFVITTGSSYNWTTFDGTIVEYFK